MALAKPTIETWISRFRTAADVQREWRTDVRVYEDLYELRWVIDGLPENIPITMPSTARAIIDEATDQSDFNPFWITVKTPTFGLSQKEEENSGRLRNFLIGWLAHQSVWNNDVSPTRDFIRDLYLYGKAVYKVVPDHEEWPFADIPEGTPEWQARRTKQRLEDDQRKIVPIMLRAVYPPSIYEDPKVGQKNWVIETSEMTALEARERYPRWMDSLKDEDDNPVRRVRIWDCYQLGKKDDKQGLWHQVLIDEAAHDQSGTIVTFADSDAPDASFLPDEPFPYVIRFSGLGRQSRGRYEERARSILYAVVSLLKAEVRRLTQLDSIISSMAWPTIFVTGPRQRFSINYGPNVVNYIPPGAQVQVVTPPMPAGPVLQAIATIQAGIERGTFGSVIRGDKPAQVTSASQLAILSGQARLRFGAQKTSNETALAEVFYAVTRNIKYVLKAPVTINQTDDTDAKNAGELKLHPNQIPEPLSLQVEVMQDPIEERARREQRAIALFERDLIDEEEAREEIGIRDTSAMRRRRIRDKVLQGSPHIIAALGEMFILESGLNFERAVLEKAMRDMHLQRQQEQMQQAMMGPTGGTNPAGSQPAGTDINATQLGGRPAQQAPTAETAQGSALAL